MKVQLNLQENYRFHLNNAITLLNKSIKGNETNDSCLIGFLSAALALELGLKLAVDETISGDIFLRDKNGEIKLSKTYKSKKTLPLTTIIKEIKDNYDKFEAIILKNFSIKIDSAILDDEIGLIYEMRNCLFHYQNDGLDINISDILKAFIFINLLLPTKLSMKNVLINKDDFVSLFKKSSLQFTGILTNANEIFVHKDNYFDINIEEPYICKECGYETLVSLQTNSRHCYLCLLCSHHNYYKECFNCGADFAEENLINLNNGICLCEACYDNTFN
jgi:hypothetical protein